MFDVKDEYFPISLYFIIKDKKNNNVKPTCVACHSVHYNNIIRSETTKLNYF